MKSAQADPSAAAQTQAAETDRAEEVASDTSEVLYAEVDEPLTFEQCEAAEESGEATVTWLDDVVIPEQRIPGQTFGEVSFENETLEIPGVPEIIVPERVGQAGCLIEYHTPGSCLPAVEISGSYIPGYRIPERVLPSVELPDGEVLDEMRQPQITVASVKQDGVQQDEVCQVEPDDAQDGDHIAHVHRPHIHRPHIHQPHSHNPHLHRPHVVTEDGTRVDSARVDSYRLDSMRVDSARIDSARLDSYRVEGTEHTENSEQKETTSYTTEGDVLFDSDEYRLRSDAEPELRAIAEKIAERSGEYVIEVEGHTDELPTSAYADNYELSELRAQSVVDWLVDNAGIEEDIISAVGLGEDYPRADNQTDEGRQLNRRVVITVRPDDGDTSTIEYETGTNS